MRRTYQPAYEQGADAVRIAQYVRQFRQPNAGVDLIERGISTPAMSAFSIFFVESGHLAAFEGSLRIKNAKKLNELGYESGPAGLMAGA